MDVFVRVPYLQKALKEGVGTISPIWWILSYTHPFMGYSTMESAFNLVVVQLFAHNAPFDSKMIVAEVDRMTGVDEDEEEFFPFIDTIDLAKQILDRGPYNLPALLDRLGLDNPDAHAAVADATATVNMLYALFGFKRGEIGRKILRQGQVFHTTNTWRTSHATPLLPRNI